MIFDWDEIESIEEIDESDCYDITVFENDVYLDEPNFIANNIIVHNCGMDKRFIERKNGREDYVLHPLLYSILNNTYGVMVYQEQVMKILNVVGNIPLRDCEKVRKGISKKDEKIFNKYRPQFIENGMKNLGWGEEAVKDMWDQIVSFAEYGFNLAHAVCYTYISSRLLWLKAHYPLEFFASILGCEDDDEKIKEYKLDAEKFGIQICKIDINKSGAKFEIKEDDKIYIGFSNIKGMGEDISQKIVDGQPYDSFEDFLIRFGTDTKVIKPLLGLRAFKDADPVSLYEFYEHFKKETKRRADRNKRNATSRNKLANEFKYLIKEAGGEVNLNSLEEDHTALDEEHSFLSIYIQPKLEGKFIFAIEVQMPGIDIDQAWKILKKYKRCVFTHEKKVGEDTSISYEGFEPTGEIIDIGLQNLYEDDPLAAEILYYGFGWIHLLEKSSEYEKGNTFADFDLAFETKGIGTRPVAVQIIEPPKQVKSRNGNLYHVVKLEDADWRIENMTIWEDDYERFEEELNFWESESRRGNLLKIRLERPTPPYRNYTFDVRDTAGRIIRKHEREHKLPQSKKDDYRLLVLARPPAVKKVHHKKDVLSKLKTLILEN